MENATFLEKNWLCIVISEIMYRNSVQHFKQIGVVILECCGVLGKTLSSFEHEKIWNNTFISETSVLGS